MTSCQKSLSAHSAEFTFPLSDPDSASAGSLRLRVAALACGAVRITRTLREAFLDADSPAVVSAVPGTAEVTENDE